MPKQKKQESLTLDGLVKYNQEVLFPYLKETFAGKKEFVGFKKEMTDFKNKNLTGQDEILQKLNILLDEKSVKDYQDKKHKTVSEIHNRALKEHKILSPQEVAQISKLEFF